ncbi:MAG: 50S ribosomal protein L18 [Planctomycetes bacterium]|jgi:large subunit ribosomal protein L18|nr:50S ribosomal protein L18 [Planctomycetota bacterium]
MSIQALKKVRRRRKALRVRNRVRVGNVRPRLSVFRSLTNIYCQVIDDVSGRTLASASSRDKALRSTLSGVRKTDVATRIGAAIAERAKAAGVTQVVFDRGPYKYHGRVKALAEAARAGGLSF